MNTQTEVCATFQKRLQARRKAVWCTIRAFPVTPRKLNCGILSIFERIAVLNRFTGGSRRWQRPFVNFSA